MQARRATPVYCLVAALIVGGCRPPDRTERSAGSAAAAEGPAAVPAQKGEVDTSGAEAVDSTASPPVSASPRVAACESVVARALVRAREHLRDISVPPPGERARPLPPRREFYGFEVSNRAEPLDGTVSLPHAGRPPGDGGAPNVRPMLVQVVVDTSGRIDLTSVKVLRGSDGKIPGSTQDSVRAITEARRWRFRPALVDGCRVRQILQAETSGGRVLGTS